MNTAHTHPDRPHYLFLVLVFRVLGVTRLCLFSELFLICHHPCVNGGISSWLCSWVTRIPGTFPACALVGRAGMGEKRESEYREARALAFLHIVLSCTPSLRPGQHISTAPRGTCYGLAAVWLGS